MQRACWTCLGGLLLLVAPTACSRSPLAGVDGGWGTGDAVKGRELGDQDQGGRDGPAADGPWPGGDAGQPAVEQALRACTIAASCGLGKDGVGISWPIFSPGSCLDALGHQGWYNGALSNLTDPTLVLQLFKCATSADCTKVRACFGGSWISLGRCQEGATCQGNKLVTPKNNLASFDCGAIGSTCQYLYSGAQRACCNAKPCNGSGVVTCKGTQGSYCHPWAAYFTFDCGLTGQVCITDPQALCQGKGGPCPLGKTVTTCQGKVASYCAGGKYSTMDCAKNPYHGRCAAGSQYLACTTSGSACDPTGYLGKCAGTRLRVCVDGNLRDVDCKALGFDGCDLPAGAPALCYRKP